MDTSVNETKFFSDQLTVTISVSNTITKLLMRKLTIVDSLTIFLQVKWFRQYIIQCFGIKFKPAKEDLLNKIWTSYLYYTSITEQKPQKRP